MTVEPRVRSLTYDESIVSSSTYSTLEEMAKDEIKEDTGLEDISFDSGTGKSALMWLLCIYMKINVGEIGAEGYQIGEIENKDLSGQADVWFSQYRKRRSNLQGANAIGHAKPSRTSRAYGSSGDTSYGGN